MRTRFFLGMKPFLEKVSVAIKSCYNLDLSEIMVTEHNFTKGNLMSEVIRKDDTRISLFENELMLMNVALSAQSIIKNKYITLIGDNVGVHIVTNLNPSINEAISYLWVTTKDFSRRQSITNRNFWTLLEKEIKKSNVLTKEVYELAHSMAVSPL